MTATVRGGIFAMRATTCLDLVLDDRSAPSAPVVGSGVAAQHPRARAGLVDHVDRLVGQMAVVDVLRGQLGGELQRLVGVRDAVVLLVVALQALAGSRWSRRRSARRSRSSGSGARARGRARRTALYSGYVVEPMQRSLPEASAGLRMFEASIVPPLTAPAPTMVWISSMKRIASFFSVERVDDGLEALLELAAVLRSGEQRAHVERADLGVLEHRRHLALLDLEREPFGDGGLADARLADEERVVLAAPAEHLDRALELGRAADQRIDLALLRALEQVRRRSVLSGSRDGAARPRRRVRERRLLARSDRPSAMPCER